MRSKLLSLILLFVFLSSSCSKDEIAGTLPDDEVTAEIVEYKILGSETDVAIDDVIENDSVVGPDEGNHVFISKGTPQKNKLFLFFPGTNSLPSWHKMIGRKAAAMGYHTIVLRYVSTIPIYTICGNDPDQDCHRKARMEILTGQDLSDSVKVNMANSIQNRVVKLLQHLQTTNAEEDWGQYLEADNEISKLYSVDKAIMLSASDWYQGAPANWVTEPGQTPASRIYAFVHVRDEAGYFGPGKIIEKNWAGYGIDTFGEIVNVDNASKPFGNTHTLVTNAEPVDYDHWFHDDKYHNGVVVDPFVPLTAKGTSLYEAVWEYLME